MMVGARSSRGQPEETDTLIGTELGEYRIEGLIGRGGMGVVYLARDDLDRQVALKLMLPELANNADFRERFIRESQAVIEHPNVVKVYEAGEISSVLYLAMEYIEGLDLKSAIEAEGRLLPARVVAIFAQAANALDAAHEKGLVHRDVKPQNILLKPPTDGNGHEHVYLSDFGLVKRTASQSSFTQSAYLMGTIQYMSPEQIEGKRVDGRADVYGLGCVLYEALTGSVPFDKESDVSVMWAHINDPPPSPAKKVPLLPESLDHVIERALAKAPDERYLTCSELVSDLASELGVSAGRRHKPVWASGQIAASVPRKRAPSGPKKIPTSGDATQPIERPIGGWIAAGLALLVAIGAFAYSNNAETPKAIGQVLENLGVPEEAAEEIAESVDEGEPVASGDRKARPPRRPREARNRVGGGGNRPRSNDRRPGAGTGGGTVEEPPPSDSGDDVSAPAVIEAPISGVYNYTQQGYEQECTQSCAQGRNLQDTAKVEVARRPSASDRVTILTQTESSNRWNTEVLTDYLENRAEITSIYMRYSGVIATASFTQQITPDTPIELFRFPFKQGQNWEGEWIDSNDANGVTSGNYRVSVAGPKRVRSAGRKRDAVKVHVVFNFSGANTGSWDLFYWVDPRTRATLKTSGTVKVDSYESSVVATLKSGPRGSGY
ncbi:MAG: serine/threonine protein kinase [Actinomycetota bacterium]